MAAAEHCVRLMGARPGSSSRRDLSGSSQRVAMSRPASGSVIFEQAQVSAMQRSRLLTAAVSAVGEFGWEGASVARIIDRAGVSRRTFYELFENRDECLLALLKSAVEQIVAELNAAGLGGLCWRERVRGGLWVILCFFDREPTLARVCLVESRRSSGISLEYRQGVIDRLVAIVEEGRGEESRVKEAGVVTAQGVVGGLLEVLYSRSLRTPGKPLGNLIGELTGMMVLPYLGAAAAQREQRRTAPSVGLAKKVQGNGMSLEAGELLATLPMRLTYRTAKVLRVLEERPGQCNREVADLVGISDQGQISKLLSRLARLGLLTNAGVIGERNKWELTPMGSIITRSIKSYAQYSEHETGHAIKGDPQHAY